MIFNFKASKIKKVWRYSSHYSSEKVEREIDNIGHDNELSYIQVKIPVKSNKYNLKS